MASPKKALAIAQDIRKRLRYMHIHTGSYLNNVQALSLPENEDARKYSKDLEKTCQVCVLGACLLSKIRLYDKVTTYDLQVSYPGDIGCDSEKITNLLSDIFSDKQLALIETAFEFTTYVEAPDTLTYSDLDKAEEFGSRYLNHKERLKAIIANIIKHNGKFVP